jgi:3-mercaptopyruvate sulfurtransferase SseA
MKRTPRTFALLLCALCSMATAAIAQEAEPSSPKLRIEWAEFKKLYDAGEIEVIDVRGDEAFAAGHIPKARSIHVEQVDKHADTLKELKKPIVTYCS